MQCRLCGSDRVVLWYTQGNRDEFRFYRCAKCRMVNRDLDDGIDQAKYAKEFIDPLDETNVFNRTQTQTYAFLRAHLSPPGRLLEIGCGNGRLLHLAARDGWSVRGLELSPFLARSVRDRLGIEVDVGDFHAYDEGVTGRYDVVVLRHVLEHLPDAPAAMRGIRRLLNDGGRAVLEFPNIDGLDLRFQRWLRRTGLHRRRYRDGYRPGHCNEFCRASFDALLGRTGFTRELWQTYSYHPVSNWIFNRWPVGNKARTIIRTTA